EGLHQADGYIFVRSSVPIFAMALTGVPDTTLTQFAAQTAPAGFVPAPQSRFTLRGRVTDNSTGAAVPGIAVVLSRTGTADVVSVTDSNGEYLSRNLIPGDYTVRPVEAGRIFAPVAQVRLDTSSRVVNFTRGIGP